MFHFVLEYQSALWPEHSCFSLSSALIHSSAKLLQHPASVNSSRELFAQMADGSDHMFRSPSSQRLRACSSSTSSRRASPGHQHLSNLSAHTIWAAVFDMIIILYPFLPPPSLTEDVDVTDSIITSQKFGNVRESCHISAQEPETSTCSRDLTTF